MESEYQESKIISFSCVTWFVFYLYLYQLSVLSLMNVQQRIMLFSCSKNQTFSTNLLSLLYTRVLFQSNWIDNSTIVVEIGVFSNWACCETKYWYYKAIWWCCKRKEVYLELNCHLVSKFASFRVSTMPIRKSLLLSHLHTNGLKDWKK